MQAAAAIANPLLANHHPFYAVLLTWHAAFDVSALIGWCFQQAGHSVQFRTQLMFVALNATTVAALWDAVRGRFRATWQKN